MWPVEPEAPTPPNWPQRRVMTSVKNPEMLITTIPTAKCATYGLRYFCIRPNPRKSLKEKRFLGPSSAVAKEG